MNTLYILIGLLVVSILFIPNKKNKNTKNLIILKLV